MRDSLTVPLGLAALLLGGCAPDPDPGPPARRYRFTYHVAVPAPAGTHSLEVWVPLPLSDPGVQTLADERIEAPAGYRKTTEPVYGNRMIYCRVTDPDPLIEVEWSYLVTRHEDRGQGMLPNNAKFLGPNAHIPLAGKATRMAAMLGVTDPRAPVRDRAKRIYEDVLDHMAYDKTEPGWGQGDFHYAVTVCKGNCTDFHSRFIGVGRAAGIPVRFTMGIPVRAQPKGTYDSYHCWAHFYDGRHWQPVDISEADKVASVDPTKAQWFFGNLDYNRISISLGRDIVLNPPQKTGPLNYFVFPHAEADGRRVRLEKGKNWKFTYEDV